MVEELVTEEVGDGVKRQILGYNEKMMMVRVDFRLNAVGVLHHHVHTQISYVLSGIFEVIIDGESKILKEGDSFVVASGLKHGVVCKQAGSLLDVFNPFREDFLPKK